MICTRFSGHRFKIEKLGFRYGCFPEFRGRHPFCFRSDPLYKIGILLQLVSIVPCLCVFGISHFGLYYLYSSTKDQVNSDNDEYLESTGYSLIDFTTRELYTLSDLYRGYSIRDYMIRYDYREQGDGEKYIDLLIFYAPIRGEEG